MNPVTCLREYPEESLQKTSIGRFLPNGMSGKHVTG